MKYLNIFLLAMLTISTISCSNEGAEKNESDSDLTEYFFPSDSVKPYVYVYAEENNPIDEKIYRIYHLSTPDKEHLIVERYKPNFRITEGYTHDLAADLNVVDHMVVDAQGMKRKAHITENSWFPTTDDDVSVFISDFPAHLDSLICVYKSKKSHVNSMDYKILGEETKAIEISDETTYSFVDPDSQKGSSNTIEIIRIYAKGFGLTEWYTKDKRIHYKLKRILSNEWWKEHAQAPSVKGIVE